MIGLNYNAAYAAEYLQMSAEMLKSRLMIYKWTIYKSYVMIHIVKNYISFNTVLFARG